MTEPNQSNHVTIDIDDFYETTLQPIGYHVERLREKLIQFKDGVATYKYGLSALDEIQSLVSGELTVIAARSGRGKTALGMQAVYHVADQVVATEPDGQVAIFSAEMEGWSLALREACKRAGVPYTSVRHSNVHPADEALVLKYAAELERLYGRCISIDQSSAPTLEHMTEQLIAQQELGPIRFVMFDYTELAGEFARQESERVRKITRGLKAIAKKFDCPVMAISQMNRDIERRANKTPTMADLMNGGEQDPDNIIGLTWADDDDFVGGDIPRVVNVHILKARHGQSGITRTVGFIGDRMEFIDLVREYLDEPPEEYTSEISEYFDKL